MNSILKLILIFVFFSNCSFNKNSKFWTNERIIKEEQDNSEEIFKSEEILKSEFNTNLKISLYSKPIKKSFINNHDNNNGRVNYSGNLNNKSKFKFSKIENLFRYNPEISIDKNNIIFFNKKGSILKFNEDSQLLWKKNYYSKVEKKQNPILSFANNKRILIIADNIAKYYALDIETGKLLWSKKNIAPFNSQIKIYKNYFFVTDYNNTLSAYSVKDGTKSWSIKTDTSLVRSQKKLSIVVINKKVIFNNSIGDISSIDIETGELIWQIPTQSSIIYDDSFFLKTSDIIGDNKNLYFSNNKGVFFSIDIDNGLLNWKQNINSYLRPTLIDNYIFTVSNEGFLFIIEKTSGNIIRVTDVFKNIKLKKRDKIKPTGFIVGKNDIYVTTDNGRLLVIDITTGQPNLTIKVDRDKILRPSVLNENLFIITENSIVKIN